MRLIGLAGLAGCGKSTVAEFLEKQHGFTRVRFAGPLKDMLRAFGLTEDEIEGHLKEKPCRALCGKTPRWAMQTLGTGWGRELIDNDLWIKAWARRAESVLDPGGCVIAEDVRFPNEVNAIRSLGGVVWRIDRPGLVQGDHVSEKLAIKADYVLKNTGTTVPELLATVEVALAHLIADRKRRVRVPLKA